MSRENPDTVVEVRDLSVQRNGIDVLEDITFSVRHGQFIGLVGPNGAGKTTLLKALLGLIPVTRGSIRVLGAPPGDRAYDAHGIGYVPQRQEIGRNFPATVADIVMMGRFCCMGPLSFPRKKDWLHVKRTLALVGLEHLAERSIGQLSGGELRRVTLAQALCASTRLLVLDEPTIGLDLPAEHEFYALLAKLKADLGLTIIAVSHDLVALGGRADELICINRRMHIHGNPEDVVHSHAIREAYSCEFSFLAGELAHHEGVRPHDGPAHSHDEDTPGRDDGHGDK